MHEETAEERYADIIDLPRPVSKRPKMSMIDRGAQFSPFAALVGYDACIAEAQRLTEGEVELDEGGKALLDDRLRQVLEHLQEEPEITVTCFRPDARKAGGCYETVTGNLKKIDSYQRLLVLRDGQIVPLDRITAIESPWIR